MKAKYIDYSETRSFSKTLLAYIDRDPLLEPFVSDWPDIEAFGRQIQRKAGQQARGEETRPVNRDALVHLLDHQYAGIPDVTPAVLDNIASLGDTRTFTVTTGHQLNIFTGPLYFIFKIVTSIRLAKDLKAAYPDYHFVPVYWMATEDHDFAEINHTRLLSHRISWDVPGVSATGRMETEGMEEAIRAYQGMLGLSENSEALSRLVEIAYGDYDHLADATRYLVNALFGQSGLVIVDADDPQLKREFLPVMMEDIRTGASYDLVVKSSEELVSRGFSSQINGRPINFFYLTDQFRERIVYESGRYQVLHQDISFNEEELLAELDTYPERFSPNVVMRPVYQEVVLPNLAYIGGGAEIVYWLQLKQVFDHFQIPFPLLVPRNSAMVADQTTAEKLLRLDLDFQRMFLPLDQLQQEYVRQHTLHRLDLHDEWMELSAIFSKLRLRAHKIDPSLGPSTDAVQARLKRAISNLEKKLIKADKYNHQDALVQIARIKEKLFPGGGLQERSENFGLLYVRYGPGLIEELLRHFHPLDFRFTILY